MKDIQFTRSSRRHRIGKTHARHVIDNHPSTTTTDPVSGDTIQTWIGTDTRDRELEIVAIERPDCWLVIHVMPTALRTPKSQRQP